MKKKRLLYGLLLIAVLSVGAYKGYNVYKEKQWEKNMMINPIFSVKENLFTKWELKYDNTHIIVEKIGDKKAKMTLPDVEDVEYNNFLSNVKNFNSVSYYSIVEKNTKDLTKWGIDLKNNYYRFFYKNDSGEIKYSTIYKGNKLKIGQGNYIYHDTTKTVYAAQYWVVAALEKAVADLRGKIVYDIKPSNIVWFKNTEVTLKQVENNQWTVENYENSQIDFFNLGLTITRVSSIRAEKIFYDGEKDIDFSNAEVVTFKYRKNKKLIEKILYLTEKNDSIYMQMNDSDKLYEVDIVYYDYLLKPIGFYISDK